MSIEAVEKAMTDNAAAVNAKIAALADKFDSAITEIAQKMEGAGDMTGITGPDRHDKIGTRAAAIKSALGTSGFAALKAGAITSGPMNLGLTLKALTSLQGSPETPQVGVNVQPDNLGVQTQAMRRLSVLSALQSRATSSNTVGFNRVSFAGSDAAGYQEGEGTEKTEAELVSAWQEAPVATIAVHTTLSKQVLDDEPQLSQAVDGLLRYGLANKIDRELMNGDGAQFHIEGLLTQATAGTATAEAAADRIGQVSATMQSEGYSPGTVFVNPADWFLVSSERGDDGHYVGGGWNAPATPNVYGMTVVQSSAVPIGEALILDPSAAMVAVRQDPTVEMSREHNGNFTKNLVTILAEVRLALIVTDPAGLRSVSLTA